MTDFIGGVELDNEIGRGATGIVFRGVAENGRQIALKVLHPQLATDPTVVGRFVQERQIYGQIKHHNVVEVTDLIADGDRLAVAMELVDGGTLAQLIADGDVDADEALRLSAGIAEGLDVIHKSGAVHRDLKPANILLDRTLGKPVPKIADFGLSRLLGNSTSRLSGAIGTPLYMSPEVAMGTEKATGASDVYALGVMLFEMLSGAPPFEGENPVSVARKHAEEAPPQLSGVPVALQSLLNRLLAKSPAERPSAAGAAVELRALVGQVRNVGPITSTPPGTDSPRIGAITSPASRSVPPPEPPPMTVSAPPYRSPSIPLEEVESPLLRSKSESYAPGFESERSASLDSPPSIRLRIAAATLLGVLAVFAGYLILRPGDDGNQLAASTTYTFLPRVVDEAVVSRTWTLDPAGGLVDVVAVLTNGGQQSLVNYVHREPLAESIGNLEAIQFSPSVSEVVEDDRHARFDLPEISPGQQVTIRYSFPAGEMKTREDLVAAAELVTKAETELLEATGAETIELSSLRLRPTLLEIIVGEEEEFVLAGTMSDGTDAADELLESADWTIVDTSVARRLADGRVVGVNEGQTELTVIAGDVEVRAQIVVSAEESSNDDIAGATTQTTRSTSNQTRTTRTTVTTSSSSTETTGTTGTTVPPPKAVQIVSGPTIGFVGPDSFQFSYEINGVCASGSFRVVGPGVNKTWTGDGTCYDSTTHGGFPQATGPFGGFDLQPNSTYQVTAWVEGVASNGSRQAGTSRDEISFPVTTEAEPLPDGVFTMTGPTLIEVAASFPQAWHPDFRISVAVQQGGRVSLSISGACSGPWELGGTGELFELTVADVGICRIVGTQVATDEFNGSQKVHLVEIVRMEESPPTTPTTEPNPEPTTETTAGERATTTSDSDG